MKDLLEAVSEPQAPGGDEAYWGGFEPGHLAVTLGPIPWRGPPYSEREVDFAGGLGLVVQPAFADGEPAAVLLTDLWDHHPAPWVQPGLLPVSAYDPAAPLSKKLGGARFVVNVDASSSFSSPFWRVRYAVMPDGTDGASLVDEATVLEQATALVDGPLATWPFVPRGVTLARGAGEAFAVQPLTGQPVKDRRVVDTWRDGHDATFLALGSDHVTASASGLVGEVPLFAFVKVRDDGLRDPLDLPFVLAHAPFSQSLGRRVEVAVDASMAVFVPAENEALRAALEADVAVPLPDAAIPAEVARAYTLRVASDASCFARAAEFPQGCRWLDSQAALEALPGASRLRTEALVTVSTLRLGDEVLP